MNPKQNTFRNFIQNQEGRYVAVQFINGYVIEGTARMINGKLAVIEKADGTWICPTLDETIAQVWPKYYTKWVAAEDYGDAAYGNLEDEDLYDDCDD